MPALTIKAPAKINLHLRVLERRPDGFHNLESIFAALDFGDTLHFEPCAPAGALQIEIAPESSAFEPGFDPAQVLPQPQNIIGKAVSLYRERSGCAFGLKIRLEKHIPLGAGLGGGSSDAAATLLALNTLAADASIPGIQPLDAISLEELGAALGSDVPFFLRKCSAAWVSGRGEQIQPLKTLANLWLVLVKPDFPSNTAAAYRQLDRFRERTKNRGQRTKNSGCCSPLAAHFQFPPNWKFSNDFLPVFLADAAVKGGYQRILDDLQEQQADYCSLSGAGSTCFGIFTDRDRAYTAYRNLQSEWNFVKFTFLLANETIRV